MLVRNATVDGEQEGGPAGPEQATRSEGRSQGSMVETESHAPVFPEPTTGSLELSIVMPCLDEAATVGSCVDKAMSFLASSGIRGEVIVADNGSEDGSRAIAQAKGARIVEIAERGYGAALLGGFAASRGTYIIMADSDDSYDFSALSPFIDRLRQGFDLVMGNRFAGGVQPGAMPFLHRFLGNPVLSAIGRLFFRSPVGDFHCGLRGFRRDALERLHLCSPGMELASEMVVKATLLGLSVTEVPTTLAPAGRTRPPHLRTWRDGWRHLRFMLLYSPRWLFLYPGLLVFLVGLLGVFWLVPGPRQLGGVTFDVHSLLYCAVAVLIGFQLLAFAVFTKMFGERVGLLPPDQRLVRLRRYSALDMGLILGAGLVVLGLAASVGAVSYWGAQSFGGLDPKRVLRIVIPGTLSLALGLQVMLSSFFLGILALGRKAE